MGPLVRVEVGNIDSRLTAELRVRNTLDSVTARHYTRGPMPEGSENQKIVVYTDGACSGNPGPGGWAWAVQDGRFETGAAPHTTNQRMEITAALQAVQALPGRLEVVSDSTYVVNCFNKHWYKAWLANGWRNSAKKPVANRDLWEPFIALVLSRDVGFRWVKGHGTDAMNQLVDELAVLASQAGKGQSSAAALPFDRARRPGATR